ncbi:MAG: hypothetical protein P1S60_12995, partial [Anaerolineae bacterium]|nr:hypothetical protein [Anaerolineae bacterium]
MWSKLKVFFAPRQFQDEEKALISNLFNAIISIFVLLSLGINIILPLINPNTNYYASLALLGFGLVLFVFSRLGGYRILLVSIILFCLMLWFIITMNGWVDGGLRNMASTLYFALTIIAGLLLGGPGTIIFGVLSLISSIFLYYAEIEGLINFEPRTVSFYDWVKFAFVEIVVILLVRFAAGKLLTALRQLRNCEQLLMERADELATVNWKLNNLAKAKDEFIANVSHELQSPITSLTMYEDLLTR